MVSSEKIISIFERLQSYGIQIALDDFGTGYSSLSYLNSFKIDIVKINGEFTKASENNSKSNIITKSIISLAKDLKIKLVAEGIETVDQLLYLKDMRCYTGQGYIFSRPVPHDDFQKLLIKGKLIPDITDNECTTNERRRSYRIKFDDYLDADFIIKEFKGKPVNIGSTKVQIKNIGAAGLCFITDIKLPVTKDILFSYTTKLLDKEIEVKGYPIWINELKYNLYEYGVEFVLSDEEKTELTDILNQVHKNETV